MSARAWNLLAPWWLRPLARGMPTGLVGTYLHSALRQNWRD